MPVRATKIFLRASLTLAMALLAEAAFGVSAIPGASATLTCSVSPDSDHCHSVWENNIGHNNGLAGSIYFTCLRSPDGSDFVNNEIWEDFSSTAYWVEVGVKDGIAHNSNDYTRTWFWADNIPNSKYFEYELTGFAEANFSTYYPAEIQYAAAGSWNVYGGNSDVLLDTAHDQPNNSNVQFAGTEFTDQTGLRDSGSVSGVEWADGNGNFWFWGHNGAPGPFNADQGPNNHVTSSYDSGTETVSWSDC